MEMQENSYRSHLPQPTRSISPGKCLSELTDSQTNARTTSLTTSSTASTGSLKHKLHPTCEPEPKRKNLVEKKLDLRSTTATGLSSKSSKNINKNGSKSSHTRGHSVANFSRSLSSSRNIANGRFSCSVGPVGRPDMANARSTFGNSTMTRPSSISRVRPANSFEIREYDADMSRSSVQMGTEISRSIKISGESPNRNPILQVERSRSNKSLLCNLDSSHSKALARKKDVSTNTVIKIQKDMGKVDPGQNQYEYQASSTIVLDQKKPVRLKNPLSNLMLKAKHKVTDAVLDLSLAPLESFRAISSPSSIPVLSKSDTSLHEPRTPLKVLKNSLLKTPFLTKDSNLSGFTEWDVQDRLQNMEAQFEEMRETMKGASLDKKSLEENIEAMKSRNTELESLNCQLTLSTKTLKSELESMKQRAEASQQSLFDVTKSLNDRIHAHQLEVEDLRRHNSNEVEKLRRNNIEEIDRISRLHRDQLRDIEWRAFSENEQKIREIEKKNRETNEEEKNKRNLEVEELKKKLNSESSNLNSTLQEKDNEIQEMRTETTRLRHELDHEIEQRIIAQNEVSLLRENVQKNNIENSTTIHSLEHTLASLRARIHFLESGSKAQSDSFAEMEARLEEAVESAKDSKRRLIKEESLRRSLFNQVQELKGNIRVMCRVRPILNSAEGKVAKLQFPDVDKESKELEIIGKEEKSSFGTVTRKNHSFSFDRVFGPETQNQEVFEEISQMVQSALDGYNVCIFCYGQTGSGKTHTMSSPDGMIPRATQQIYQTASDLKDKGWVYSMEGNFIEVYNEEIHDLLGNSKDIEKKKHEIRHDDLKKQTRVTGLNTVILDSPSTVESILKQADTNRSVAATKSNERSSRSHSVFMLKLVGYNSTTNERSEGTLNLVDLAGSERLKQSGAEGERMKETQSINKSLSCLGDVIGALGQGKEGTHIPYRNSKLTYLLQYSLGGNSKTLMFVMASPLEANLTETLTSLKFAKKASSSCPSNSSHETN
ncbi:Kinesin-like protein [Podosphaera aphanis]|nr:Kinesin-like protein [Podosphaera aphanis]